MRVALIVLGLTMIFRASHCFAQDNLIDISIVLTAPADTFSKGSIEGIFKDAFDKMQISPKFSADRIKSYSDYLTMRRLIEDPGHMLRRDGQPLVYFVDDRQGDGTASIYRVRETDFAKHVSGIAVQYQTPQGLDTRQWNAEAGEVAKAVFRATAPSSGEFEFAPDPPDLDIQGYQLLYDDNPPTASWLRWPGRRARFEVDIRGFPGHPDTYRALKEHIANAANRVSFTGESSNTIALAEIGFNPNAVATNLAAVNGLVRYQTNFLDADRAWYLLALTAGQRDAVSKSIRNGIKTDTLDEFKMAASLAKSEKTLGYSVVDVATNRVLDGRSGPQWFQLEKTETGFQLQLTISNEGEWRKRFSEQGNPAPGPAFGVLVFQKNNSLLRLAQGQFWAVMPIANWNGGAAKK